MQYSATGKRWMGSQQFRFQETDVTVSAVWSKQLVCPYNGCIKSVTMIKHFRLQKISSIEERRKSSHPSGCGKRGYFASWCHWAMLYLLVFLQCVVHRSFDSVAESASEGVWTRWCFMSSLGVNLTNLKESLCKSVLGKDFLHRLGVSVDGLVESF